jgi:hypothetical protein
MEGSRRRRIFGCHEGLPSMKVFSLHTEQNIHVKLARWHRVYGGYQKVIQR